MSFDYAERHDYPVISIQIILSGDAWSTDDFVVDFPVEDQKIRGHGGQIVERFGITRDHLCIALQNAHESFHEPNDNPQKNGTETYKAEADNRKEN